MLASHLVLFRPRFETGGLFRLWDCATGILRGDVVLFVVMKRPA